MWGARGYVSRSENCAFQGRRLHGKVTLTVAAGAVAFREPVLSRRPRLDERFGLSCWKTECGSTAWPAPPPALPWGDGLHHLHVRLPGVDGRPQLPVS